MFFNNYANLYLVYIKKHGLKMLQIQFGKMFKMLPEMEEKVTKKFQDDLDAKISAYEEDKAKHNAQAFAVIDVYKDGKLFEQEVVDALTPETKLNIEFHRELGMITPEEAENAERALGCAQQ